jgi:hypothetical protein
MSKKSIKIILEIVDPELLDEYKDASPETILSSFIHYPRDFANYSDINIEIKFQTPKRWDYSEIDTEISPEST